jgi:putative transposase
MELWHVLNRGVDKRTIFLDDRDRFRFAHGLALFNTRLPANNTTYILETQINDLRNRYESEDRIVDIHAWCLMDNHYHLLLSERAEGGMTLFLRKLNIGYANYFNERYERSGGLFQGRTKKKNIDSDRYFLHILHYIHLNPLDILRGNKSWREGKVPSTKEALKHLSEYRWSSYLDYSGRSNFPSILTTELFSEALGNVERATRDYLRACEINSDYTLE